MTQNKKSYTIIAGPTKEDLLAGPFTKNGKARAVSFTITSQSKNGSWAVSALLATVKPVHESDQGWTFTGLVKGYRPDQTEEDIVEMRGFYNPRNKKGSIEY